MLYEANEDSMLLEKYVKEYAFGNTLDIGTGSGIQALAAAHSKKVKKVIAVDIQKDVIGHAKKTRHRKIQWLQSDLFSSVQGKKFDTIIFNPPYLPEDPALKDLTIEGGKKGYETIERFLNEVNRYLRKNGIILLLFSSLTKPRKVISIIKKNRLNCILLEKKHIFFEDLFVYLIKKDEKQTKRSKKH